MSVLILCPLPAELEALLENLRAAGFASSQLSLGALAIFEFAELGWRCALAGHGKTQFGIQTQFFIDRLPDLNAVICAGCAGGLASEIQAFDVVGATATIEHDYQLKFVSRPSPEFAGDAKLLNALKLPEGSAFKLHKGRVASGDEDIVDLGRARTLHLQTSAMAVAWEGAGGARAARFNDKAFLELRAITDIADHDAPVDFMAHLPIAMKNLTSVLLRSFT